MNGPGSPAAAVGTAGAATEIDLTWTVPPIVAALIVVAVFEPPFLGGDGESRDAQLPPAVAAAPAADGEAEAASGDAVGGPTAGHPSENTTGNATESMAGNTTADATPNAANPEVAMQALQERVATDPGAAEARGERGLLLAGASDLSRAAEAFAAAVELRPGDGRLRGHLGAALLFSGLVRVARAELRRAIELDPSLADAQLKLGITYSHTSPADMPAAREAWRTVIALEPGSDLAGQAEQYLASYPEDAGDDASLLSRAETER